MSEDLEYPHALAADTQIPSETSHLEQQTKLSVRGLVFARGAKPFARIKDFDLCGGQSVALVGPSGSGKSTALMALAGIHSPAAGTILIDKTDPWVLNSRARDRFRGQHIGLVFQSFHLVDAISVSANIKLASKCAPKPGLDKTRLSTLLDRLGLSAIQNRRADRISHGQAQRVAVARAMFNAPDILLADEPTSALDDRNADTLMSLLTEAAVSENAGLVVATHDRRVLDAVDCVVEMEAI